MHSVCGECLTPSSSNPCFQLTLLIMIKNMKFLIPVTMAMNFISIVVYSHLLFCSFCSTQAAGLLTGCLVVSELP